VRDESGEIDLRAECPFNAGPVESTILVDERNREIASTV
jgi:hypothetical protein